MNWTEDQHEALYNKQSSAPEFAALSSSELAQILAKEGDPLFADVEILDVKGTIPALGVGAPMALTSTQSAQAVIVSQQAPARLLPSVEPGEFDDLDDGIDDLDESDLIVPRLALRQAMSQDVEDVPIGHFYLTTSPDMNWPEVDLVVLRVGRERAFWLPFRDPDKREGVLARVGLEGGAVPDEAKILCRSSDRITPHTQTGADGKPLWEPLSKSCAKCEHAKWRKVGGQNIRSCKDTYELVVGVIVGDSVCDMIPARLSIKGGSFKAGQGLLSQLKMAKKIRRLPACAHKVTLRSVHVAKGEPYEALQFGAIERLDDDDTRAMAALAREFADAVAADEDEGEA